MARALQSTRCIQQDHPFVLAMTPNFLDTSTKAVDPSRGNASRPVVGAAKTRTSKADREPSVRFGKVLSDLKKENDYLNPVGTATESSPSLDSPPELMQITLAMPDNVTDSQEPIETTHFQISGELISQEATSALPSTFVSGPAAATALTGNQAASSQNPLGLRQDPRLVTNISTHQLSATGATTSVAQSPIPGDRGTAADSQATVSENQTNQAINLGSENSRPTPWVAGNTSDIASPTNHQGEVNVIPTILRTIRNQNANFKGNTTGTEATTMEAGSTSATPIQEGGATEGTRSSSFAGETAGWQSSDQPSAFSPDAPTASLSDYQTNQVTTADLNSFSQIEASLANLNQSRGPANRVPGHLVDLAPETLTKPILESVRRQLSQLGPTQADALDKGIKIELAPRELGSVTVEVKTIDNVTKIQIVADQPVAHALLEKNIEALLQSLDEGDGNTFDVDVSQRDSDAQSKGEQKRQPAKNASNNPNGNEPTNQSNPTPPDAPSEGGVNMVV